MARRPPIALARGRRDPRAAEGDRVAPQFLSTSIHKIDRKGRVSVPASFRAALQDEAFAGVALAPPLSDQACVEGSGRSRVEQLAEAIAEMNPLDPNTDALAMAVLAPVQMAPFDAEGRIVLPASAIERAGLTERALFAGLGRKFQIWAPEAFEAAQAATRERARAAAAQLSWSGPKTG